jgi:sulfatase modifying factor 1
MRRPGLLLRWFLIGGAALGLLSACANAAEPKGETFAILVGVRKYPPTKFRELPGAENDVTDLAALLKQRGVKPQNIVLLTNTRGADDPRYLPIAANIGHELDLLLENRADEDRVLVGLAGHGVEPPGKPYYFCPYNADLDQPDTLISIEKIYGKLKSCKAGLKVLWVDACRENPLAPAARSSTSPDNLPQSVTMPTLPDPPGGIAAFFSCSKGQTARERVDKGPNGEDLNHGVFFQAVIQGLRGEAADTRGEVTVPDLEKYVKRQVETYVRVTYSAKQYPDVRNQTVGLVTILPSSGRDLFEGTKAGQRRDAGGLKLVWIPPGDFTMGSPKDEKGRNDDEGPVTVTVTKGFWLGEHEVTQAEWQRVMQTVPWSDKQFVKEGDDYPATYVSWEDTTRFCEKLTAQERSAGRLASGWRYTLPTEAQWEYACRSGTKSSFSFGDDESDLGDYAWFTKNADDAVEKYAHLVGQKKTNPWGLFDMHGNVWEWCRDWYAKELAGGADPQGPSEGWRRVLRGGSWSGTPGNCRSAFRAQDGPDGRSIYRGFRIALSRFASDQR